MELGHVASGLHLTSADSVRFEEAMRVLLRPLDFDRLDDWRLACNESLKRLLEADTLIFHIADCHEGHRFGTDDYDTAFLDAYVEWMATVHDVRGLPAEYVRRGTATRESVWGDALYQTSYYNEFLRPIRSLASMAITLPQPSNSSRIEAELIISRDRASRPYGPREVEIGRLLRPALRAGLDTWRQSRAARAALAGSLDAVADALLLCDRHGRELHRNATLRNLIASSTDGDQLLACLRAHASALVPTDEASAAIERLIGTPSSRSIRLKGRAYRLSATFVGLEGREHILVAMRPEGSQPLDADAISRRFDLTPRQAEVAALLADRKSNQEIAEDLFISPHTARHHTAAVLCALNVDDRRDVAHALREPH